MDEYLFRFRVSASNAAAPTETEVFRKCEGANVSRNVKSQTKGRQNVQGIRVGPLGGFPSPQISPGGSKEDETLLQ